MMCTGLLEGESPIRVEKRYLGSFSVPFETIYTEGRVEGVFRLDTPAINFGYDHAASGLSARSNERRGMFEGDHEVTTEDPNHAPVEPNAPAPEGTLWDTFMRLLECLSQTHSQMLTKHPDDSLYYSGSHLHRDTQVIMQTSTAPASNLELTFDFLLCNRRSFPTLQQMTRRRT
jgi:hypothetical protein